MTDYTAAKDKLLLKVVQWIEAFETRAPRAQFYHDLGHLALKDAQSHAEPKPSVGVICELGALIAKPPTLGEVSGPCYFVSRRLLKETVAALLAKDADIATVIRDNDEKMEEIERLKALIKANNSFTAELDHRLRNPDIAAKDAEIERLKTELHSRYLVAQGAINARQEMEAEATRLMRENEALRNPDIKAACEKLDFDVWVRLPGASDLIYHGKLTPHSRGVIARAILTREPG